MKNPIQVVGAKMALPAGKWQDIVQNALLVGVAAGLTWLTQNLGKQDLGDYTPAYVAAISILLNYIQKMIANPVNPSPNPLPGPMPDPSPIPTPDNNTDNDHDFPIR